jgi:hypothetical protein
MTGLYLMLLFRLLMANACLGIALYGWLAYRRQRGQTLAPAALKLVLFVRWFGFVAFGLLVVLSFWPSDRSWMNDFFHSLNRVLRIF